MSDGALSSALRSVARADRLAFDAVTARRNRLLDLIFVRARRLLRRARRQADDRPREPRQRGGPDGSPPRGHALVGVLTPHADPVRKVSIIPRRRSLGVTFSAPDADRLNYDVDTLVARTPGALAGRAAEELVYGNHTTGAESDLEQVTAIARQMVGRWGMSDLLAPPVAFIALGFVIKWLFIIAVVAALVWLITFFAGRARANV